MDPVTIGLILGGLTLLTGWTGAMVAVARSHIDTRIELVLNEKLAAEVKAAVVAGVAPLDAKIDGMSQTQTHLSEEVGKIHAIDVGLATLATKVTNGLEKRQERMDKKLDRLLEDRWDGQTERRDG